MPVVKADTGRLGNASFAWFFSQAKEEHTYLDKQQNKRRSIWEL